MRGRTRPISNPVGFGQVSFGQVGCAGVGCAALVGCALVGCALVGCDRVFGLETPADAPPQQADAAAAFCFDATMQLDEDADGIVDGCDPCPQDGESAQHDLDGDHIGDVCDPNPTMPIDTQLFFDGMVEDRLYQTLTGSWAHVGGQYTTTLYDQTSALRELPATTSRTVDAKFASIDPQALGNGAGVRLATTTNTLDCVFIHLNTHDELQIRVQGTAMANAMLPQPPPPLTPMRFHLTLTSSGKMFCKLDLAILNNVSTSLELQTTEHGANAFGFVSLKSRVAIDSVMIVDSDE